MNILIPKKENLSVTSTEDSAALYYKPFVGRFFLQRLVAALNLMRNGKKDNVLEIGCGSGILLLELNQRFRNVHAIDIHPNTVLIREMLKKEYKSSTLARADIQHLPYKPDVFDCVVCLSVLEHVEDLNRSVEEAMRVTRPDGNIILGIPVDNVIMTFLFRMLGYKIHDIHKWSHKKIIDAIKSKLIVEKISKLPAFSSINLSMYVILSCRKRS